jgi:ring-1,2-phenylacetyl-CoA epoxidase subunit PaaD
VTVSATAARPAPDAVRDAVHAAIGTICDPEYPDVSIVDLGLLETLAVDGNVARVGLIPTFGGCPALRMIESDVRRAVEGVDGVDRCEVTWLRAPVWTTDRITGAARHTLASAYTVVLRRADGGLRCPVCGGDAVEDRSVAGPTRCRSVAWCPGCRNPVEVLRA